MTFDDFFDQVEQHPELEGAGICDEGATVRHKPSGLKTKLLAEAIRENGWERLEPVLTGRREATPLSHMSRVVGYFSRVENWNRSKIGELKDRQRGNYAVGVA